MAARAGHGRNRPRRRTALLPLGFGAPDVVSVACYALAGLVFAPYGSLTTALLQRASEPSSIAQVLAAQRTVLILSGPVGVGLGGLLVTTLGVRPAFLIAALGTVTLGICAAVAQRSRSSRTPGRRFDRRSPAADGRQP